MRFDNVNDMHNYLAENASKTIAHIDLEFKEDSLTESVQSKVKITSFFDSPVIQSKFTDRDNEIFVESVDVIKDACGTGKLELLDRTLLINVCESDNVIHINLDIEVDGMEYRKVPFTVKLNENKNSYIMLNRTTLV